MCFLIPPPPKGDQAEEFDCGVLHWFVHVTEEGSEEGLFSASNGDINSTPEEATQPAMNNTEEPPTNPRNHPNRSGNHFGLCRCKINDDSDVDLIRNILPGMVDNNNKPLTENIPTEEEEQKSTQPTTVLHGMGAFRQLLSLP